VLLSDVAAVLRANQSEHSKSEKPLTPLLVCASLAPLLNPIPRRWQMHPVASQSCDHFYRTLCSKCSAVWHAFILKYYILHSYSFVQYALFQKASAKQSRSDKVIRQTGCPVGAIGIGLSPFLD